MATVGVRDLVFALRVHKRDTCILYLFIYMIRARPARGPNDERQRQGAGRDRHGGRGIELSPWRAEGRARVRGARTLVVHRHPPRLRVERRRARLSAPLCESFLPACACMSLRPLISAFSSVCLCVSASPNLLESRFPGRHGAQLRPDPHPAERPGERERERGRQRQGQIEGLVD